MRHLKKKCLRCFWVRGGYNWFSQNWSVWRNKLWLVAIYIFTLFSKTKISNPKHSHLKIFLNFFQIWTVTVSFAKHVIDKDSLLAENIIDRTSPPYFRENPLQTPLAADRNLLSPQCFSLLIPPGGQKGTVTPKSFNL